MTASVKVDLQLAAVMVHVLGDRNLRSPDSSRPRRPDRPQVWRADLGAKAISVCVDALDALDDGHATTP